MKKRVTGIGGIFFTATDPKKLKDWYGSHLGFDVSAWGAEFHWKDIDAPETSAPAVTAWSLFPADTTHFQPGTKQFMLNYRVENLVKLMDALRAEGVTIVGKIEEYPYGKFGWIVDPEGNKIELWEPIETES